MSQIHQNQMNNTPNQQFPQNQMQLITNRNFTHKIIKKKI